MHVFFCIIILISSNCLTEAQVIKGTVLEEHNKQRIAYANIKLVGLQYIGKSIGVSADERGEFLLAVNSFPVSLEISAIGFISKVIKIESLKNDLVVELESKPLELDDFVVSAEKVTEKELRSPIQIEKLDLADIKNSSSFNFYDAVINLKGIDVATQSIIISSVNARGFNSTTNLRFKQFTDGIDTQAPGLGFSLGNIVGPTMLDVESVELIPGPATSKYGSGTFNGVLLMTTKNPFDYQGLNFEIKGATITADKYDDTFFSIGNEFIHDISARYAKAFNNKLGFKVNASRLAGTDFPALNFRNVGPGAKFETSHSPRNQGINGVNVYGDDRAAYVILPKTVTFLSGESPLLALSKRDSILLVTREGYQEGELVDYNSENVKLSGALHYRINPKTSLIAESFYGRASTMITGIDRIALRDFEVFQHKLELKNDIFFIRAYGTSQNSGGTFNVGKLGENINQAAKPDEVWYSQYIRLVKAGLSFANARRRANSSFPFGNYNRRFIPGTEEFNKIRKEIIGSNDSDFGAAIFDKSRLFHLESQIDINPLDGFFETVTLGGNARLYDPESKGTIFTDSIGNDVRNFELGLFVEATKKIKDNIDATISARIDKNESFGIVSSQRLSFVKNTKANQFFRGSIQTGLRIPNVREQFLNQDLGDVILVGGLKKVVDHYQLQGNAFLASSLKRFNEDVENQGNDDVRFGSGPLDILALRLENQHTLEAGIVNQDMFQGIKPERITSLEFGYKELVENKMLFEVIYYINHYNNFIGTTRVVKPRTSPSSSLLLALEQANNPGASENIYVSDNARKTILTQGIELLYDVTSEQGTNFAINMTFANILSDNDDPVTPGFNTPPFKLNMTLGNDRIGKHLAAEISWRYRSSFKWESSFVDGIVPSFNTFDFQATYRLPKIKSMIRIGGNNVLNREQFNSFGGPEITAYYYISFSYGL